MVILPATTVLQSSSAVRQIKVSRSLTTHIAVTFLIDAFLNSRSFINNAASIMRLLSPDMDVSSSPAGSAEYGELLDFDCNGVDPRENEEVSASSRTTSKHPRRFRPQQKCPWLAVDKKKLKEGIQGSRMHRGPYWNCSWEDARRGQETMEKARFGETSKMYQIVWRSHRIMMNETCCDLCNTTNDGQSYL